MKIKIVLNGLFTWMESITKHKKPVYVFLASSDQFFVGWMQKKLDYKITPAVIGDLSKQETKIFYEYLIVKNASSAFQNRFSFEELYELTGFNLLFFFFK